jgi:hypothetical protein
VSIDDFWNALLAAGWVDGLPEGQAATLRKAVESQAQSDPERLYLALATGAFDAECMDDEEGYTYALDAYREASGQVFTPTDVAVKADRAAEEARVSFSFRGERFETVVPFEGDYFEEGVHDLVNAALERARVEERFFILPAVDQNLYLAFARPAAFQRAVEVGAIPPSPPKPAIEFNDEEMNAALEAFTTGGPEEAVQAFKDIARMIGHCVDQAGIDEVWSTATRRENERRRREAEGK